MSLSELDQGRPEPMLIAAEELAALLNISKRTLWRLRSAGALPSPVQLGAAVRWRLDEVRNWIAAGCPRAPGRDNTGRRK